MAETYYAAEAMNRAIDMVTKGLRDLRSRSLEPFYRQPEAVPVGYAAEAYEGVRETMDEADLDTPTQQEFAQQLSDAAGTQLFVQFMADAGIVLTEDEPDVFSVARSAIPDLGPVSTFLAQMQDEGVVEVDVEAAAEISAILGVASPPSTTLHLVGRTPRVYAELDPIVSRRLRRMREYIRSYFAV